MGIIILKAAAERHAFHYISPTTHHTPRLRRFPVLLFLFLNVLAACDLVVRYSSIHSLFSAHSANQFHRRANSREERRKFQNMAVNCKVSLGVIAAFVLVFAIFMPAVQGHGHEGFAPAPAPTSDGTAIDQGIAYGLMLLALVLTYLIHTFDAPLSV